MADRVGQQLGNYQIVRLLGQGGFAEVYLGEHVYLRTKAAIKVLHAQLAKDDMDGFIKEARTIANLVHPNIVRVLEFGVQESTPFLVLDYAPNGSLRERHPRGTHVPLTNITSYVKQVAAALQYAHNEKLVHRDIKPENMLLGRYNDVLLSDFGIALIAQSTHYQGNQDIAGTVAYMAPEQIQGKPRPASDQYSLGIVVYEWLSGNRPFHGSFTELCTQHVMVPPPPLREKILMISPEVEQVVMTALAKDPKERFGTVQAFARALEEASRQGQTTGEETQVATIVATQPVSPPTPPPAAPGPVKQASAPAADEANRPTEMATTPAYPVQTPPPAPAIVSEQNTPTTPEQNIATELVNTPEPPLAAPRPSLVPPMKQPAPATPLPEATPQPVPFAAAPPARQQEAGRRPAPSSPEPVQPALRPRRNLLLPIIAAAIVVVLVLGGVLLAPGLLKGSQVTPTPVGTGVINHAPTHPAATATANLSALTPQQLYTAITSRTPTLIDTLNVADNNGWDVNNACAFTNGAYQITNPSTGQYQPCMARNTHLTNFAYQVQGTLLSGTGGGLIFRSDNAVSTYYRFSLDNNGLYKLFICQQCTSTKNGSGMLLTQATFGHVSPPVTLTVIANSQTFDLYINGTFVKQVNDASASAGEIGLYAFSSSQVAFSNLKVWGL